MNRPVDPPADYHRTHRVVPASFTPYFGRYDHQVREVKAGVPLARDILTGAALVATAVFAVFFLYAGVRP